MAVVSYPWTFRAQAQTFLTYSLSVHLNSFNKFLIKKLQKLYVTCCWVRIDQRVGYELIESGYETSEPGYESSGYERFLFICPSVQRF